MSPDGFEMDLQSQKPCFGCCAPCVSPKATREICGPHEDDWTSGHVFWLCPTRAASVSKTARYPAEQASAGRESMRLRLKVARFLRS